MGVILNIAESVPEFESFCRKIHFSSSLGVATLFAFFDGTDSSFGFVDLKFMPDKGRKGTSFKEGGSHEFSLDVHAFSDRDFL